MFVVSESSVEAIHRAYETGGELSAVVELRRLFPGIADNDNARRCVRMILGWTRPELAGPEPPPKPKSRKRRSTA